MSSILELLDALYKLQNMKSEKKLLTSLVVLNKLHGFGGFSYQNDKLPELGGVSLYDFEYKRGHGSSLRHYGAIISDFWNYVSGAQLFNYIDFAWSNVPTLDEIIKRITLFYV